MTSSGLFHDYRLIEEGFVGTNGFHKGEGWFGVSQGRCGFGREVSGSI